MSEEPLKPRRPKFRDLGPVCSHDMPCPVLWYRAPGPTPYAVYNVNARVFQPSWAAQRQGWMLVRPPWWLRGLLKRYTPR